MSGTQTVAVPEWVWVPKAARIAREAGLRVQVGGGVRTQASIDRLLAAGVSLEGAARINRCFH